MFVRECARLRTELGDLLVDVHHIGSTAIPTIRAKPIVDVLPVVSISNGSTMHAAASKRWASTGGANTVSRDAAIAPYKIVGTGRRVVNAHFFAQGDPEIERHLAFRDYCSRIPRPLARTKP